VCQSTRMTCKEIHLVLLDDCLMLHYLLLFSCIYRDQTGLLQHGCVRLQNICLPSPTDMLDMLYWLLCISASRSRSVCSSAIVSTGQHRRIYRRSVIQSAQMHIDCNFTVLTMATWSCLDRFDQHSFCFQAEPLEQATTAHSESV